MFHLSTAHLRTGIDTSPQEGGTASSAPARHTKSTNGFAGVHSRAPALSISFARANVAGAAAPLIETSVAPGLTSPSSSAQLPGLMYSTSGQASMVVSESSQTPWAFFFFLPLKTTPTLPACAGRAAG